MCFWSKWNFLLLYMALQPQTRIAKGSIWIHNSLRDSWAEEGARADRRNEGFKGRRSLDHKGCTHNSSSPMEKYFLSHCLGSMPKFQELTSPMELSESWDLLSCYVWGWSEWSEERPKRNLCMGGSGQHWKELKVRRLEAQLRAQETKSPNTRVFRSITRKYFIFECVDIGGKVGRWDGLASLALLPFQRRHVRHIAFLLICFSSQRGLYKMYYNIC